MISHRESTIKKWTRLIESHSSGNLSVPEFCRDHKVNENNFYSWRSKLKKSRTEITESHFTELKLSRNAKFIENSNNSSGIQIYIKGNVRIILENGFNEDTLLRTVKVLSDI